MMIIGCDYHPSWQQIAWVDTETGETGERKLMHADGEAERFHRQLPAAALIGMESTGNSHWFVDLVTEMGHQVLIGDAAAIRGNRFVRMLLVEAAHSVIRCDPGFRKQYLHRYHKKPKGVA